MKNVPSEMVFSQFQFIPPFSETGEAKAYQTLLFSTLLDFVGYRK